MAAGARASRIGNEPVTVARETRIIAMLAFIAKFPRPPRSGRGRYSPVTMSKASFPVRPYRSSRASFMSNELGGCAELTHTMAVRKPVDSPIPAPTLTRPYSNPLRDLRSDPRVQNARACDLVHDDPYRQTR
jgi:hypothetical protein